LLKSGYNVPSCVAKKKLQQTFAEGGEFFVEAHVEELKKLPCAKKVVLRAKPSSLL